MLALYLGALDRNRQNHNLLFGLFGRLLRQCVSACEESVPERALVAEFRRCALLVREVTESNVAVRADVSMAMLGAVFELREAYRGKFASILFGETIEEESDVIEELLLDVARKAVKEDDGSDPDRLLETVQLMFRPSTRSAAAVGAAKIENNVVESPNYGLIRKRQRQAAGSTETLASATAGDPIILN